MNVHLPQAFLSRMEEMLKDEFPAFLESYQFDGKDVYPFITHEGSGFGRSLQDLKTIIPHAYIHEGLAILGHQVYESEDKIKNWVGE